MGSEGTVGWVTIGWKLGMVLACKDISGIVSVGGVGAIARSAEGSTSRSAVAAGAMAGVVAIAAPTRTGARAGTVVSGAGEESARSIAGAIASLGGAGLARRANWSGVRGGMLREEGQAAVGVASESGGEVGEAAVASAWFGDGSATSVMGRVAKGSEARGSVPGSLGAEDSGPWLKLRGAGLTLAGVGS